MACFRRLPATDGRPEKWLYLDTRRPHTHDVRAMLVLNPAGADSLLLTGANDAQLFAYSVFRFQTVSPPADPVPCTELMLSWKPCVR